MRGWATHGKHAARPLTFIAIGESTCDPALNEIFHVRRANHFGEYCGEEIEKEKSSDGTNQSKSALDIDAEWTEDHGHYQRGDGCAHCLAGRSIQGMGRRNPLGFSVWCFDLGDFLWQYPDQQVFA